MYKVGQKVFYYGANRKYHGGVYKIVGKLSGTIWRLRGGDKHDFYAEEKDLQPMRVIYDCTKGTPKQLALDFGEERCLDDLM